MAAGDLGGASWKASEALPCILAGRWRPFGPEGFEAGPSQRPRGRCIAGHTLEFRAVFSGMSEVP
jgi:hypothetical protein